MAMIFVVFIEILEVLVLRRLVLFICYDVLRFTFYFRNFYFIAKVLNLAGIAIIFVFYMFFKSIFILKIINLIFF
jgi:hypothetical protein